MEKRQSYNVVRYKMFNAMRIRYVARNASDTLKVEEEDGFKLSSAIGDGMAELILDERASDFDIRPFSLDRFARGELIRSAYSYGTIA